MDCRWTLCLAAAVLTGVAGCDSKTFPLWPSSGTTNAAASAVTMPPPTPPTPPGAPVWKAPADIDLSFPKVSEAKPATLVAHAKLMEQAVAKDAAQAGENRETARKDYLRALEMDPKYVPAHLGLARFFEAQDDHPRALKSFKEALKLAPQDPRVWMEAGMCHARHKEWKDAIQDLRTAFQLDPANQGCGKALGLCLARGGLPDEAVVCLMNVEGEAQAHYTVARMMHHLKQDTLSRKHARQALVADPKLEGARQLLAELEGGEAPVRGGTDVSVFDMEKK